MHESKTTTSTSQYESVQHRQSHNDVDLANRAWKYLERAGKEFLCPNEPLHFMVKLILVNIANLLTE